MAAYKYTRSLKKRLSSELVKIISSLRKENVHLKKTLAELSHHHGEHNKLVERLLALETLRLESCQQLPAKDEKAPSLEDLSPKEGNSLDGNLPSEKQVSSNAEAVLHLQNKLNDASVLRITLLGYALEKNRLWLEYDQQREAYVRAILDKMLWLEKHLNEANQAHSQQHNEEHSDAEAKDSGQKAFTTDATEGNQLSQLGFLRKQEAQRQIENRYESLLKDLDVWLDTLRKQVEGTHQELINAEKRFKEREKELDDLTHQVKSQLLSKVSPQEESHVSEEEEKEEEEKEQQLREKTKDLQARLKEEKRRSTNFELQANVYQRYMLNYHHVDQEKIADLERQIKISSQDLEDAKRDSSYLKKQMVRILKKLPKAQGFYPEQSKREQQELGSCELVMPPSSSPRDSLASSAHSSTLDESFLECPTCQTEYPANQYRSLLKHLEVCLE